jgi:hypothetical protein
MRADMPPLTKTNQRKGNGFYTPSSTFILKGVAKPLP